MKRRILKAISLICACVMLLTLAACGEESQDNTGKYIVFKFGNDNIYLDEVYIYAQTTIDEYEKEYGSDIWGKTIETDGGIEMDVEEMARREVISNIVQTKALIAQADEYKISLTEEEQAQAEQEAGDFYNSLTDEQLKETGMEADTPSRVLQENALAKKIYDHVMSDSSAEVSDEQARMTTFYDMFFECYYEDDFVNIVV